MIASGGREPERRSFRTFESKVSGAMARSLRKREELAAAFALDDVQGEAPAAVAAAGPASAAPRPTTVLRPARSDGELRQPPPPTPIAARALQGHIDLARWPKVKGWVWDPATPGERIRLELADGHKRILTAMASVNRPDLVLAGIGDGLHGFDIDLNESVLGAGRHVLHLRCADSGAEVSGSPVAVEVPATAEAAGAIIVAETPAMGGAIEPAAHDAAHHAAHDAAHHGAHDAAAIVRGTAGPPPAGQIFAAAVPDSGRFRGYIDGIDAQWRLSGWAYDPAAAEPLTVELVEGGSVRAAARASEFRDDLLAAGLGQGNCAFHIRIPGKLFDGKFRNLRVYGVGSAGREPIGNSFGMVFPRLGPRHGGSPVAVPAWEIFEQVSGTPAPATDRPGVDVIDETSAVLRQLGDRFGHAAALGLLYAYVLRRPIDNDGLATRLTRIHSNMSEYRSIVQEVLYSDEAALIHGPSKYLTLHPLRFLSVWLDGRFGMLELPA